jgi:molybdopterin adenylyltransferase
MRRAVVITVSTRAAGGQYADAAGPVVADLLREAGFDVGDVVVIPDGREVVADALRSAAPTADLVVTNGGTGLTPRDLTPEATADVVDRVVPGLAEMMRAASLAVTPMAALSRAIVGTLGTTLVINLPGSPKAAAENLGVVLPVLGHALDQLHGGDHPR